MEKFDSAYLAYLCVWFQNITVKHFIPIYVGLKLITILWINIQKVCYQVLFFSPAEQKDWIEEPQCHLNKVSKFLSDDIHQRQTMPHSQSNPWWYSYHAIGREEKLKFPLHLFLGITCTRRKKTKNTVLWIFENFLYIVLTCTWTISLTF